MRGRFSSAAYRAMPLLALSLIAITPIGCTAATHALMGKPEPFKGQLQRGQLVRAIVMDWSHAGLTLNAALRTSEGYRVEEISFTNAPDYRPAEGGTMVVFRVLGSWSYHTPDDASGMHEWISVFNSELVAVEMSEAEAIAAARACLQKFPDPASYDLEDPFTFGPGERGGWIVRFDKATEQGTAANIDLEIDWKGRCESVRPQR